MKTTANYSLIADSAMIILATSGAATIKHLTDKLGVKRRKMIRVLTRDGRFSKAPRGYWKAEVVADEIKVYKNRDSATAKLRSLGVTKADFDLYISKNEDGTLSVNVTAAKQ